MSDFHKLFIRNVTGAGINSIVQLDGQPLDFVQSIDLHVGVDSIVATITMAVTLDVETLADLQMKAAIQ